jgi:Flagellar capping protein
MAIDGVSSNQMRFWGLASGLDVDEIVRGFMLAERAPLDRLLQRRQLLEWQQEELRTINRMLRELDDLAFQLRLESTFSARQVSVSHEGVLTARAGQGAAIGTHTIKVHQLAEGLRLYSSVEIEDGKRLEELGLSGSISFKITRITTGASGEIEESSDTITINPEIHTARELAEYINAFASHLGIKAVYEPDLRRFFITGTETGADVQFRFDEVSSESGSSLGDLFSILGLTDRDGNAVQAEKTYSGRNAIFEYNGAMIERSTNQFTAGGVTFTLLEADPSKTITVNVSQDTDAILEKIESFVNKYNEIVTHINGKLTERRYYDYPPLTEAQREEMSEKEIELWEEKAKSGLLRGDALLTRILSELRLALSNPVRVDGSTYSLADIGITTGRWDERGILHLDKDALRRALEEDVAGVAALFRQDGAGGESSVGIVRRIEGILDTAMDQLIARVGRAGAPVDDSTIGRQIGWLNDAIERAEARLAEREAHYYRQFSVLEQYMSMANTQMLWLMQTFGGF